MIFHCYKVNIDERMEAAISAKRTTTLPFRGSFLGIISKPSKTSHDLVKAIFLKHSTGCSQNLSDSRPITIRWRNLKSCPVSGKHLQKLAFDASSWFSLVLMMCALLFGTFLEIFGRGIPAKESNTTTEMSFVPPT